VLPRADRHTAALSREHEGTREGRGGAGRGEHAIRDTSIPVSELTLARGFGIRSTVPEFRSSSFNEERPFSIPAEPLGQRENRETRGRGP